MKKRHLVGGLAATTLLVTGCGSVRGELVEEGMSDGRQPVELAFVEEIEEVDPLAEYNVVDVGSDEVVPGVLTFDATDAFDGSPVDTAAVFGDGPVAMGFLTNTCPICVTEAPKLAASAGLNPDLTYVVVHTTTDAAVNQAFAEEHGLMKDNIVHIVSGDTDLMVHFGILAVPSYIAADADGRVSKSTGALEDHGLAKLVDILRGGAVTVET